jgi:hypothetical protein
MSFCEGRDWEGGEDVRNATGVGVGSGCCGSRVITGGAEKNCGDVGGRVTGVVVREGDGGRFDVVDVMGIAVIRW